MKKVKQNEIVSIEEVESGVTIWHDGVQVGFINVNGKREVYIEIDEAYRGKHYASNGLYLFDQYAHQNLNIEALHAVIHVENDIAKHVVEHSGYHIVSRNEEAIFYTHEEGITRNDDHLVLNADEDVIYLAGGCFWGMERVFKVLDGVVNTKTGYANGSLENPSYEDIIRNETGYKETVRVIFDTNKINLETILKAYFICIDPTVKNQQGEDIGSQYQTGVYYKNLTQKETLEKFFEEESKKYDAFYVELEPLSSFYEAEEYHQDYLDKNPNGYCHITLVDINKVKELNK